MIGRDLFYNWPTGNDDNNMSHGSEDIQSNTCWM